MLLRFFKVRFLALPLIIFIFFSSALLSARAAIIIEDIVIDSTSESEIITLKFSTGASTAPISTLTGGAGWIRLDLQNTDYASSLAETQVFNGFLKTLRMYKVGQDAQMEAEFHNTSFFPAEAISIASNKSEIKLTLSKLPSAPRQVIEATSDAFAVDATADSTIDVASSANSITGINTVNTLLNTPPHGSGLPSDSSATPPTLSGYQYNLYENLQQILIFILILLAVAYLLLYVLNKYGFKKFNISNKNYQIKVLGSRPLSAKQKIAIVEINGKKFACGVTKDQINYLTLVPDQLVPDIDQLAKEPSMTVAALRTIFLERRKAYEEKLQKENQQTQTLQSSHKDSFSKELISKIKNLKKLT